MREWDKSHCGIAVLSFTNVAIDEIKKAVLTEQGIAYPHYFGTVDSFIDDVFLRYAGSFFASPRRPHIIFEHDTTHFQWRPECYSKGCVSDIASFHWNANLELLHGKRKVSCPPDRDKLTPCYRYKKQLLQKEQSLIHRKQMAEICDIIKKRMALERYDPTNHFVSMSDVVSIFARRGAGKTTFVKSLIEIFRHSDKVHGVDCGDLLITDVIEPNQIQRKENFMIRFLAAIHGEFTRLVDRKDIDTRDRKPFEDKTRKLYEALPVVDGIGKLSLYSDWDDNEYVAEKFMQLASNVKDLEHHIPSWNYNKKDII